MELDCAWIILEKARSWSASNQGATGRVCDCATAGSPIDMEEASSVQRWGWGGVRCAGGGQVDSDISG